MKKGEIWLVELPSSDGHEQAGSRPAIVVSEPQINASIIIPLTTNVQALRFPYTLEIRPTKRNGLSIISVALLFQLRAIDSSRIKKKIGDLEDFHFKKVNENLRKLLEL